MYEAWAHSWMGNLSRALDLCIEADELLTSVGMEDSDYSLNVLDLRGNVLFDKSEYREARQLYAQMAEKTSPTCSPFYHAHSLCNIVHLDLLMEGKGADIVSNVDAAEAVYVAHGSPNTVWCSLSAAELKIYRGDIENARTALLECLSKSREIYPSIVAHCLAILANPAHRMHGPMDTFRWAVVYLACAQKAKDPADTSRALCCLAQVHTSMKDDETALRLFHAALEGGTEMDIHHLRADCMVGIGDIVLRRGNLMQAKEMWEAAHPLFVRSRRMDDSAAVEKRLEELSQVVSHFLPAAREDAVDELCGGCIENPDSDTAAGLPQFLPAVRDDAEDEGTNAMVVVLKTDSDTEWTLKMLETLSVPNTSPPLQVKTSVNSGSSPAKLPVL
jgi:predicted negative regulator of RcsB-dependent stress response